MGEIIFKTELIKGAKGDRGEAGQADSIPTDGVIAFQGETVPDGYEETDPGDVFDEVYEDINAVKDMIADEYDTTATYNAGDYCTHENVLYKCTATTTGLWDGSKWVLTSAGDETKANAAAIEAIVNEYGAKNLLPNNAISGSEKGVTFTVNSDGSITANGTATDFIDFTICDYKPLSDYGIQSGKSYVLSGTPSASESAYIMLSVYGSGSEWRDTSGNGVEFTPSDTTKQYRAIILITQGTTVSNLTFYPMIRDARITDDTYVPYTMTNRELTDAVNRGSVSVVADGVKTYKQLLNELYVKIDVTKLSQLSEIKSVASWGTYYYGLNGYTSTEISFTSTMSQSGGVYNETYMISSDSIFRKYSNGAAIDESSTIASASQTLTLIY